MNIVITGVGIVSAIGNNLAEVLDALLHERSGIAPMRFLQSEHKELPVGEVKLSDAQMKEMLSLPQERIVSRTTLMGALAIRQALKDACLTPVDNRKMTLVCGTTVGGMDITERYFSLMKTDDSFLPLLEKHDCGSTTDEMAELSGLKAETCTISTACSSALNAIIMGAEMLRNHETDIVIAGGSESLSKFHLNGFHTLMILDRERCRPFDETRAGLNLGEGAAFVVLTREGEFPSHPRAYISGYGNACDAFHQTASSDEGEGAYLAMREALDMSGLAKEDIQYINAHGTGTPNNDLTESVAIRRLFGQNIPLVSSTKSFTGHTTSASGSIELVISLLAMEHEFVPSNLGWSQAMHDGIVPSVGMVRRHLENVMCNSFGFGGNDSSLIISRGASLSTTRCIAQHDTSHRPTQHVVSVDTTRCLSNHEMPSSETGLEAVVVSECIIDDAEQLKDSKDLIPPMESRRMGKLLKAATITSLRALKEASVDCPDAIVTATAYGMIENSEKFLSEMCENGETLLKPTLFMQSTHNTLGSSIAIRLGCHGYNITYSHGSKSWEWAMRDARRLIQTGKAETVLVGFHDESTPLLSEFYARAGKDIPPMLYSRSVVLKKGK